MKRLLALAIGALLCAAAAATTLNPIQLLNPAGSTSGQVIVSTGPSTVPAWGGIGLNGIAAIAANTVLANATGSSASPTAFAVPSCSTSASALTWTTSSGFTCNTAVNAATLGGATFASPGSIGGTTAAAGKFTTLQATSTITPSSTNGIVGTATNDNANAGSIGEYPSPTDLVNVSMSSGTAANISSISLTAGDWDIQCSATYTPAATTTISAMIASVSLTSATHSFALGDLIALQGLSIAANNTQFIATPIVRKSLGTTTTVYCVSTAVFATSTLTSGGHIRARRVR